MARAVVDTSDRRIRGTLNWVHVVLLGAALGVVWLVLSWLLSAYVIDVLVCRSGTLAACGRSEEVAGNIAAVIVAVIGVGALIRLYVQRAFGVAVAVLASFWGLSALIDGLRWFESVAWLASLYALAYLLFANIFRIRSLFAAIILAALAVLLVRWVAFL